jgi:MOSC domain-containing protein YiiM
LIEQNDHKNTKKDTKGANIHRISDFSFLFALCLLCSSFCVFVVKQVSFPYVMNSSTGKLVGLYIGSRKGEGKTSVESAELVADYGLRGDSHAGRDPERQVSLFAVETLREIQNEGFEVSAGSLSANLFTENIDLDSLNPGARLRIGEAVVQIAEARKPCRSITKIDNRLPKRLFGQCGQVGLVVQSGLARVGDEIQIMLS